MLMMVGGGDHVAKGMWQASSYDEGQTWSDYKDNGCKSIVANPTMVAVNKGNKLLIWHHAYAEDGRIANRSIAANAWSGRGNDNRNRKALNVYQSESTDGGKTWDNTHVLCVIENASPCINSTNLSGITIYLHLYRKSRQSACN